MIDNLDVNVNCMSSLISTHVRQTVTHGKLYRISLNFFCEHNLIDLIIYLHSTNFVSEIARRSKGLRQLQFTVH